MAKPTEDQMLWQKPWIKVIVAAVSIVVAYGFASLAIDSGSLWQYAAAIIFFIFGAKELFYGVKHLLKH